MRADARRGPSCAADRRAASRHRCGLARASSTASARRLCSHPTSPGPARVPPSARRPGVGGAGLIAACSPRRPSDRAHGVRPRGARRRSRTTRPRSPRAWSSTDGVLYEGTGLAGLSELRELDPATGAVLRSVAAARRAVRRGHHGRRRPIWQLTWQDGVALEWDRPTLEGEEQVALTGEGWGLCHDGSRLVRSDGTATPALPRPHHVRRDRRGHRDPRRAAGAAAQRAGVRRTGRCGRTSGRPTRSCASTRRAAASPRPSTRAGLLDPAQRRRARTC